MTGAEIAGLVLLWYSVLAAALFGVWLRRPATKKPIDRDALESADAALRNRIIDLEDKFEHHLKRDAVRIGREKRDVDAAQGVLPLDPTASRAARLSVLRQKVAERQLNKGA